MLSWVPTGIPPGMSWRQTSATKMTSTCRRRKPPSTRTGADLVLIARPELALVAGHVELDPDVRCLMR